MRPLDAVRRNPWARRAWGLAKRVSWWIRTRGIRNPELPSGARSMLFLCKGNICRSPFAARLAAKLCERAGATWIESESAGIEAKEGTPAPGDAVVAAGHFGITLEDHRSRGVLSEDLERSDLILVMEVGQLRHLRKMYRPVRDRVFLLPLFDPDAPRRDGSYHRFNIPDPYGRGEATFLECYSRIKACLDTLIHLVAREGQ